jgi:NAD-dependent deacetylase
MTHDPRPTTASVASNDPRPASGDAARLADLLLAAGERGTVAFTGAGVSTESGIPDFRGPTGLWAQYAPISYEEFLSDPAMRREAWRRGLHTYAAIAAAAPNPAHLAIAEWWRAGRVAGVVTQNIDGLHQRGGLPDEAVAELHGNAHGVRCLTCGAFCDRAGVQERVRAGDEDPACAACGGMLKPTTVSFGQPMPQEPLARAERLLRRARLCLVIGSSLVVYPAAALPELTLDAGGRLAIVNATETHLDPLATLVSRQPAGALLGAAASLVRSGSGA